MEMEKLQSLLQRLQPPKGEVDVVLDTDTTNEIDDQFALAYLLASREKARLQAVYAAPFHNEKSSGPEDGMEKSYQEIMRLLELSRCLEYKERVYKGSRRYLPGETTPVISPAAEDLAARTMGYSSGAPLYVVAIGALTNVASAILLRPEIVDRIVIVWLGGNAFEWPDNREFNALQDVAAARVVFNSGAAVVQLPCMGVVSSFRTTGPELEYHLRGKNPLCDYLVSIVEQAAAESGAGICWSRPIWDVTAVAWVMGERFVRDRLEPSPILQYDHHYSFDKCRHPIRYVYAIERDQLFEDLFKKLARFEGGEGPLCS